MTHAEADEESTYPEAGNLRDSAEFAPPGTLPVVAAWPQIHARAPTAEVHLLRSYIKLATPTLAGLIGATFIGGLVVGVLVGRGHSDAPSFAAPPATTRSAAPSSVTVVATPVGTVLKPTVVGNGAPSVAPPPAIGAAANRPSGSAGIDVARSAPGRPSPSTETGTATAPPSPAIAPHPAASSDAPSAPVVVAPLPRTKAPESAAESPPTRSKAHSPSNVDKTARSSSARRSEAAVRPTAAAPRTAVSGTAKPAGGTRPAARSTQGKSGWHDPFAE